jgi:sec-independent protein translocase protein TatB
MFDISFSELVVIGMVALIVIGPERLPRVSRTLGHLFGRAQRYVRDIRIDIERQIEMEEIEEMKRTREEASRAVRSIEQSLNREMSEPNHPVKATPDSAAATPEHAAEEPAHESSPPPVTRPPV